jgi:hypothetical protein
VCEEDAPRRELLGVFPAHPPVRRRLQHLPIR